LKIMKMLKPLLIATSIFVLMVVSLALFSSGAQSSVSAQAPTPSPFDPARSVTVIGVGEVRVVPDEAVIVIGVQTQAESALAAMNENSERMDEVVNSLRAAGIQTADIQTRTVNLFPRYAEEQQLTRPGLGEIIGYTASNQVEVRARQIANVGAVIDNAIMAGANTIDGIRFEVSNPVVAMDQARQAAMTEARRKAEQLAELADASLGNVLTISEFSRTPGPVFRETMVMDVAVAPIEPGTETIEVEVQVSWYLE
jgi:uncharacterized protein